jgi:hypothetical protein
VFMEEKCNVNSENSAIMVRLFLIDYTKYLIDDNSNIYHYTDHVCIGKWDNIKQEIEYAIKTQEEYDDAMKYKKSKLVRLSNIYFPEHEIKIT